jgi:hypothetical protein
MIEIDDRVIRPQLQFDFVAKNNFAATFDQHAKDSQRLLLQVNAVLAIAQFTAAKVNFEATEPHSIWQRVHKGRTLGAIQKSLLPPPLLAKHRSAASGRPIAPELWPF